MKHPILILHGWALTGDRYSKLQKIFEKKGYKVLAPTMPGFGKVQLSKEVYQLADYVEFIKKYLDNLHVSKVIIVGHSFGGRVAVKFAAYYPNQVEKLILSGAPIIKQKLNFKKQIIMTLVHWGKNLFTVSPGWLHDFFAWVVYRLLGEWDYYKAGKMKKTLIQVLHEDLAPILPSIKIPTLLLWGDKDTFVLSNVALRAHKKLSNSKVILVNNQTHKFPYENPELFAGYICDFLK
jgi:pimeloyl-ACP methyl ester carboxylesterase